MVTDLLPGAVVSYQAENRRTTGHYGELYTVAGTAPAMLWPGANTDFGVDVDEKYEEVFYTPGHGASNILEGVRNVKLAEELPFGITVHPQVTGHWPLLQYITGSTSGFGDEPDSTSWMKEVDNGVTPDFSVYTGVMFEDYKCDIPGLGIATETISGHAAHRAAIVHTSPAEEEAVENTTAPIVWNDIKSIRMDATDTPVAEITHCLSDISFGFTSEVSTRIHPESLLSTKQCGVRVASRKMFVSLKLTWVDQSFLDIVTGSTALNLKMVIGTNPDATTMQFDGLFWPKYIAKAQPKELVGDTVTCVVDRPGFAYSTA